MVLARLRADAPSDTRGVDGEQARRRPTAPHGARRQAGPQAPRQGPRVKRHREPRRL